MFDFFRKDKKPVIEPMSEIDTVPIEDVKHIRKYIASNKATFRSRDQCFEYNKILQAINLYQNKWTPPERGSNELGKLVIAGFYGSRLCEYRPQQEAAISAEDL